jgi:signal transduction histidine kinase
MHSLRWRLVGMMAAVAVIALVAVAMLSSQISRREFHRLQKIRSVEQTRGGSDSGMLEKTRSSLEELYRSRGDWTGVGELLAPSRAVGAPRPLLVDPLGRILFAPAGMSQARVQLDRPGGVTVRVEDSGPQGKASLLIRGPRVSVRDAAGREVGILTILPPPPAELLEEEKQFVGSVNRWLVGAVAIAGALAFALALALSRRILGPVHRLTNAAQRLSTGDLSQRVQVESRDEIGQLGLAFNGMADGLARLEQLRHNMVGDVAHELRTPLTNIRGQLEAVQDGLTAPTPELVDSLHEEILLLSRLVDDLQELAVAEAGQLRFERQSVDVAQAVEAAVRGSGGAALERSARQIGIEIAPNLPRVEADPGRLAQILRNLIANATAHTSASGRIVIGVRQRGAFVEVEVRDDGEGIAPEHLPLVFERFYRADLSRGRATGGAGLGLAIVRQLVRAHGGDVRVESEPGAGAAFFFTLPAVIDPS